MLTRESFLDCLRDALNNLYNPASLRASPLVEICGVANRMDTSSALRHILIEAIDALKPEADVLASSRAWRLYDALYYYYVQQFSQPEVADQLGLSIRHVRREQRTALDTLADHLWVHLDLGSRTVVDVDASPGKTTEPMIGDELDWAPGVCAQEPIDLKQALPALLDLVQNLAKQYRVRLAVHVADSSPSLAVNSTILRQALLSLLTVAIHRTVGGRIMLSVRVSGWNVAIHIQGQTTEHGAYTLSPEDAASLGIARRLVEMAGGQLHLDNGADRFGATVILPALERLPILVVDDNADTLRLIQRYTSGTRYRMISTQEPAQVIPLAQELSPQLIMLDVMMPDMDGWELLGRLRQHTATQNAAVIVCTILPQKELALSLGAADYLSKPFSCKALLQTLDRQAMLLGTEPH